MSDIDQQAVFDRLPLTAEQRKQLYEAITGAERQTGTETPAGSSEAPCFLVPLNCSLVPLTADPSLQTH